MSNAVEELLAFMMLLCWLVGIVLAKGFWSTFFAVFFAPWAWYLVVEKFLSIIGWL